MRSTATNGRERAHARADQTNIAIAGVGARARQSKRGQCSRDDSTRERDRDRQRARACASTLAGRFCSEMKVCGRQNRQSLIERFKKSQANINAFFHFKWNLRRQTKILLIKSQ